MTPSWIMMLLIPLGFLLGCLALRFSPVRHVRLSAVAFGVVLIGSIFGHQWFHASVGPIPITLDRLLLLGLLACICWQSLAGRLRWRGLNRLDIAILVWLAIITLSTVTHRFTIMNNMPASRLLFFNWVPALLYFLTSQLKFERSDLKGIALGFSGLGVYLALTAVAEVKQWEALVFPAYILDPAAEEFLGRGRGPFLNPVANGTFLLVGFCCGLMLWPRLSPSQRPIVVGVSCLLAVGVFATLTRSTWLALVAACGFFIWIPAPRRLQLGSLVATLILAAALYPALEQRLFSFKRDRNVSQADMEQSAEMRPLFAQVAWKMFQERPLVGVGFGQYAKSKYPYLKEADTNQPLRITRGFMQHNVFLAYVTEVGLVGLTVLLYWLTEAGLLCWRLWTDRGTDLWSRQFGLLGLALLTSYAVNGMFHDVSIVPMEHVLLFFVLGIVRSLDAAPLPALDVRKDSSHSADLPATGALAA